uniref:Ig-like domain-containing protein n=1 Tax=Salarias fasciatus TaxID=181472 RepID=A0A672H9F8_SALFA
MVQHLSFLCDAPSKESRTPKLLPPVSLFCVAGSSSTEPVSQTPRNILSRPAEKAEIYCSHSIDNYDKILWYKQSHGELQLLGYIVVTQGYPETGLNLKMHGDANKNKNSTLTMEKLQVSSSAVYFCAASYHSAPHHCSSVLKPPHQTSNIHSHLELTS